MMRNSLLFVLLFCAFVFSQTGIDTSVKGNVTFVSSQLVYVKFEHTEGIEANDTLFTKTSVGFVPSLIIKFISSSSTASEIIGSNNFNINDEVFAFPRIIEVLEQPIDSLLISEPLLNSITPEIPVQSSINYQSKVKDSGTNIFGRISSQSYSNFSNFSSRGNYQRWRHSFRFAADQIEGTGLSFSQYSIFAYKANDWNRISTNLTNSLKVYDLSLGYRFDESTRIWVGRHLNRKISNISTVDGIQFERDFSSFSAGLVAGSRPNFSDFGYNAKLFEYGAYLNKWDSVGTGRMENTISFFEQTNNFITDRRFIYLQHTNNAIQKTSFFISSEIDLYKKILNQRENSPTLTSIFVSARYSPIREISFSASYDARKNVIYYETFKSFIDSVFENETRQGFRFRTNILPVKYLSVGLTYGYRYRKSDDKPNTNYGGYLNYSLIPFIDISSTVSYNKLNSSYIEGNIYSLKFSKSFSSIYLDLSAGFRFNEYKLLPDRGSYNEKSVLFDISTGILKPVFLTLGYEGIFQQNFTTGRVLADISFRF
ncbi:MAG: hypothetical protein KGZ85_15980 [Ignavibacterium sp.]|nr:hypothetical protein [Ignavibacterium sp.]